MVLGWKCKVEAQLKIVEEIHSVMVLFITLLRWAVLFVRVSKLVSDIWNGLAEVNIGCDFGDAIPDCDAFSNLNLNTCIFYFLIRVSNYDLCEFRRLLLIWTILGLEDEWNTAFIGELGQAALHLWWESRLVHDLLDLIKRWIVVSDALSLQYEV